LAGLPRLAGGSARCAAGTTLAALAGLTAVSRCSTVAAAPARPTFAAGPAGATFAAGPTFAAGAVAVVTWCAVAAVAVITARIVGGRAVTTGMDGWAAEGVGGRRGAQRSDRRSQDQAGSCTQTYGAVCNDVA
jgi:hypothetical protein